MQSVFSATVGARPFANLSGEVVRRAAALKTLCILESQVWGKARPRLCARFFRGLLIRPVLCSFTSSALFFF
jgi:hypothetical protein